MFYYSFLFLSILGSLLTVGLSPISWWWLFPIFLGYCLAITVLMFVGITIGLLFLPKGYPVARPSAFSRWMILRVLDWLMRTMRIRIVCRDWERLPEGSFVMVCNHRSDFDPMTVLAVGGKRKISFISKESNFKIPLAGPYIRAAGFLAIDRGNAMRARRTLKQAADMLRAEEMVMGVYPEGTRSRTGKLLRFKEGAFLIAKEAEVPVAVLCTTGTDCIKKNFPWRRTEVVISVLEVFDRETVATRSTAELCAQARETIEKGLSEG